MSRELKVGLLVVAAAVVLAVGTFMVGERENLFAFKNRYYVRFPTVGGLAAGSPVQLNGVNVGKVESIVLPERIEEELLTVWLSVERRFEQRVRADSLVRIKTLGLLGDKYLEITSGSPGQPRIESGGQIPAAPMTDVEQLIASGEDLVDNVVAISVSLRNILAGMEAGEGILGELTTDTDAGRRAKNAMISTLESVRRIAERIENGEGTLAALINDDDLLDRAEAMLERFETVLGKIEEGDGALPALISDPETKRKMKAAVDDLGTAAGNFADLSAELNEGQGLLGKLLKDEEYSQQVSRELQQLIENLNKLSAKIEQGEGTLGQLINDPEIYQAVDDILVGIDESRLLRWLIRNRQRKGIKERYEAEQEAAPVEAPEEVKG